MHTLVDRSPIVVGTDGSTTALGAVRWAAGEAAARQVPLRIVHVAPPHDPDPMFGAPDPERDFGGDVLLDASAAALETARDCVIAPQYRRGDVRAVLRREASDSGLLVLGSVGRDRLGSLLLGSTATELAVTAPCSVVFVTSHPDVTAPTASVVSRVRPVLAVLDGAEDTWGEWDMIVAAAVREARLRRTTVLLASSADPHGGRTGPDLSERIAQWHEEAPDVRIDSVSRRRNLPEFALSLSHAARLVVVGPPEHDRVHPLGTMGRTVHTLLHSSGRPVMIVRNSPIGEPRSAADASPSSLSAGHTD